MKKVKIFVAFASMALLSACTVTPNECDPSVDPGFFNKIGCTISGSYAQRNEAKKEHLVELREELHFLSEETQALNDENALVNEDRTQFQSRLDRINEDLDRLERKVASSQSQNNQLAKQLAVAKAQTQKLKAMPQNASILEKQVEKQKLEAELDELLQAQTAALEP